MEAVCSTLSYQLVSQVSEQKFHVGTLWTNYSSQSHYSRSSQEFKVCGWNLRTSAWKGNVTSVLLSWNIFLNKPNTQSLHGDVCWCGGGIRGKVYKRGALWRNALIFTFLSRDKGTGRLKANNNKNHLTNLQHYSVNRERKDCRPLKNFPHLCVSCMGNGKGREREKRDHKPGEMTRTRMLVTASLVSLPVPLHRLSQTDSKDQELNGWSLVALLCPRPGYPHF